MSLLMINERTLPILSDQLNDCAPHPLWWSSVKTFGVLTSCQFTLAGSGLVAVGGTPFAQQSFHVLTSDFSPFPYVYHSASTHTG